MESKVVLSGWAKAGAAAGAMSASAVLSSLLGYLNSDALVSLGAGAAIPGRVVAIAIAIVAAGAGLQWGGPLVQAIRSGVAKSRSDSPGLPDAAIEPQNTASLQEQVSSDVSHTFVPMPPDAALFANRCVCYLRQLLAEDPEAQALLDDLSIRSGRAAMNVSPAGGTGTSGVRKRKDVAT